MRYEYKYVRAYDNTGEKNNIKDLNELLAQGWEPFRESPMGIATIAAVGQTCSYVLAASLVVLRKRVKRQPKKTDAGVKTS
jgi:uncharacterized protein (DUF4213/DUF364 family)